MRSPMKDIWILAASRAVKITLQHAVFIAMTAHMYTVTGSASWSSINLLCSIIASVAFTPIAGVIVDRYSRKRVIICSEMAAAILLFAASFAESPAMLIMATAAVAIASTPIGAAIDAAVAYMSPPDELQRSIATMSIGRTVGCIVGPLSGGVIVAAMSLSTAFIVQGSVMFGTAAMVACVRNSTGGRSSETTCSTDKQSCFTGLRLVFGDQSLRILVGSWSFIATGFALITIAELPLALAHGAGTTGYGAIATVWSVGALIGCAIARRMRPRSRVMLLAASGGICVSFGIAGVAPLFWMVLAAMFVGGFAVSFAEIADSTLIQARTHDAIRGQVLMAKESMQVSAFGVAVLVAPLLLTALGPHSTYLIATGLSAVGGIGFIRLPAHNSSYTVRKERRKHAAIRAEVQSNPAT